MIQILIIVGIFSLAPLSIVFMLWIKKSEKNSKLNRRKKQTRKNQPTSKSREDMESDIGLHEIKNNVQVQKDGGYSVVLEYTTPDYSSLKNEEQDLFETKIARAIIPMQKKFKIVEFAGNVRTLKANKVIEETIQRDILPPSATEYAKKLAKSLNDKRFDLVSIEKRKYFVIGSYEQPEEKALEDIRKQVKKVVTNFGKADTHMKLLETNDLIQIENELINYDSKANIDFLESQGVFELFSTGGRKV